MLPCCAEAGYNLKKQTADYRNDHKAERDADKDAAKNRDP
jgi:hypothetical protein